MFFSTPIGNSSIVVSLWIHRGMPNFVQKSIRTIFNRVRDFEFIKSYDRFTHSLHFAVFELFSAAICACLLADYYFLHSAKHRPARSYTCYCYMCFLIISIRYFVFLSLSERYSCSDLCQWWLLSLIARSAPLAASSQPKGCMIDSRWDRVRYSKTAKTSTS